MKELTALRTLTQKVFDNDDRSKTKHAYVGHEHYENKLLLGDGVGGLRSLDWTLAWDDSRRGWSFKYHSFHPFLPEYADEWVSFRDLFEGKDQTVRYKAVCAHVLGRLVPNIPGLTDWNAVIYDDAFGAGKDYILYFTRSALVKAVRIREGTKVEEDQQFAFAVEFPSEVKRTDGETEYVLDTTQDKTFDTDKTTLTGVDHRDGREWFTYLRPFKMWDSERAGRIEHASVAYKTGGSSKMLIKTVPLAFIEAAIGDVFTDVTTSFYVGAGDGYALESESTFAATRSGPGEGSNHTGTTAYANVESNGAFQIVRPFIPVDASPIPDSDDISEATLKLYTNSEANSPSWIVAEGTQASTSEVVNGDYDACTLDSPIEYATRYSPADTSWGSAVFNATGIAAISKTGWTKFCIREAHDVDDVAPGSGINYQADFDTSEGTHNPYLSVKYGHAHPIISKHAALARTTVRITPPSRAPQELITTDEPVYDETPAGASTAYIPCKMPLRDRDRLEDAKVRIFPPRGLPWLGRVVSVDQDGELGMLECVGAGYDLSRVVVGPLLFHDDDLRSWRERTLDAREKDVCHVATSESSLRTVWDGTIADGAANGIWRTLPETDGSAVSFRWDRPDTGYALYLYSGVYETVVTTGHECKLGWTQEWTQAGGAGATDGIVSKHAITNTHDALMFLVAKHGGEGVSDEVVYFRSINIYGVDGVDTITAPNVINYVCDQLPAWILPAGDEYRAWIDSGDTTEIGPLAFNLRATAADVFEKLQTLRDYDIGLRPRMVNDVYVDVPVYEERDDTPAYQVFMDAGSVTGRIQGSGIESMANVVRVPYKSLRWEELAYVDVPDTGEENYLVTIGQGKHDVMLRSDIASEATATLMGEKYLALRRKSRVSGGLTLDGPILNLLNSEVLPCEIEARRYMRVHSSPLGTIDGRITYVMKYGGYFASVTLDNTPPNLDVELALLKKQQT